MLNRSDIRGGAARAAYRIHHALRASGIDSRMWVNLAMAGDWTVQGSTGAWGQAFAKARVAPAVLMTKLMRTRNPVPHSPAFLKSGWPKRVNRSDADLVHLHWVNGEMLSIEDIGRIRKPIVWTLHDMWAFCGAEHYTEDLRWREGYIRDNRPSYESGIDINRWVWRRKLKAWRRPMQIVTPSHWLAECVRQSRLLHGWPVSVVHYPIDTATWSPVDKEIARQLLGLQTEARILLFGAMGGGRDLRKGFDLLKEALRHLRGHVKGLQLVVFGQLSPRQPPDLGFPVRYVGHLHDDSTMRVLYSAADVTVIPSRQDNLPNVGIEALACATPVVAFDTCGLPDVIRHQETGFLAKAFDAEDLARGIEWVLADEARHAKLRCQARADAAARFSYPAVAAQYRAIYQSVLASCV